MTTEQTLMPYMKMSSGLTSGRCFQNSVLVRCLIDTSVATTTNDQNDKFTNTFNITSEQHVDQQNS